MRGCGADLRVHASSSGVLLGLAPVVVHAVDFSPFLVLLLLMPIAAVHRRPSWPWSASGRPCTTA